MLVKAAPDVVSHVREGSVINQMGDNLCVWYLCMDRKGITVMSHECHVVSYLQPEHHAVPNHQHLDCVFNSLFKLPIKENIKTPYHWPSLRETLQWLVDSPHRGPVMRRVLSRHDVVMGPCELTYIKVFMEMRVMIAAALWHKKGKVL